MTERKKPAAGDVAASLEEIEKAVGRRKPARPAGAPAAEKPPAAAIRGSGAEVRVRLVRSGIAAPEDQKQTLRALGLRRLNQEVVRGDSPAIRGMIHKVRHLVEVNGAAKPQARVRG